VKFESSVVSKIEENCEMNGSLWSEIDRHNVFPCVKIYKRYALILWITPNPLNAPFPDQCSIASMQAKYKRFNEKRHNQMGSGESYIIA
jgi:hypothetical protein